MRHTKINNNELQEDDDDVITITTKYIIILGKNKLELTQEQAEELHQKLGYYL